MLLKLSAYWTIGIIVVCLIPLQGCGQTQNAVSSLSPDINGETASISTSVTGTDNCLEYEISVDNGTARYGSDVSFRLTTKNTCTYEIKWIGAPPGASMCIVTYGHACQYDGNLSGDIYVRKLPRDGSPTVSEEFFLYPGESKSVTFRWDPEGDNYTNPPPVPAGYYDVYAGGLGLKYYRTGYYSQHLTVEVVE